MYFQVLKQIDPLMKFVTLLCYLNVTFILKLPAIQGALGPRALTKFMGARALLIISQVQPEVLSFIAKARYGADTFQQVYVGRVC